MEPLAFCYWLRGFTELNQSDEITAEQWLVIRQHLESVFNNSIVNSPLLNNQQGAIC